MDDSSMNKEKIKPKNFYHNHSQFTRPSRSGFNSLLLTPSGPGFLAQTVPVSAAHNSHFQLIIFGKRNHVYQTHLTTVIPQIFTSLCAYITSSNVQNLERLKVFEILVHPPCCREKLCEKNGKLETSTFFISTRLSFSLQL